MNKWQTSPKVLGTLAFAAGYYVGRRYTITLLLKKEGK